METIVTYPHFVPQILEVAAQHKVKVHIGEKQISWIEDENGNQVNLTEIVTLSLEPDQEGQQAVIIAHINETGYVHVYTKQTLDQFPTINFEEPEYRRCDECHVQHERHDLYIVKITEGERTGEVLQVGGSCAKKLNCEVRVKALTKALQKVYEYAKKSNLFAGTAPGRMPIRRAEALLDVLKVAKAFIQTYGMTTWKKAQEERSVATAWAVQYYLNNSAPGQDRNPIIAEKVANDTDNTLVFDLLSLIDLRVKEEGQKDYYFNLRRAVVEADIDKIGLLTAGVHGLLKHRGQLERQKREAEERGVTISLTEKQKFDFIGRVTKIEDGENQFGTHKRVTVMTRNHGKIWFKTTNSFFYDGIQRDDVICGRATVTGIENGITFVKTPHRLNKLEQVEA